MESKRGYGHAVNVLVSISECVVDEYPSSDCQHANYCTQTEIARVSGDFEASLNEGGVLFWA
jgi:hypothetical protein